MRRECRCHIEFDNGAERIKYPKKHCNFESVRVKANANLCNFRGEYKF